MSQRSTNTESEAKSAAQELPRDERLLIGLGAAIAAGCLPCSSHYLEKARQIGLRSERLRQIVALAVALRTRAAEEMAWRVLQKVGGEAVPPGDLTPELERGLETFVGFGAAFAANSPPLVRRSVRSLREKGVPNSQIKAAAEAARKPKGMAAEISDREIEAALGRKGSGPNTGRSCCSRMCCSDAKNRRE